MTIGQKVKQFFWGGPGQTLIERLKTGEVGWEAGDFLSANEISLYLNRAIRKRAEKVGEIEFVVHNAKGAEIQSPILQLLNRPNKYMSGTEFWALYQTYKDLTGSVYIWKETSQGNGQGKVLALHLLRPDLVKTIIRDAQVEKYEYKKPGGQVVILQPNEVIRAYYPDPMNPFFGMPLVRAGNLTIDTEIQLASYHSRVLRNGGRVDGVFHFPSATEEQVRKAKQSFADNYAGAEKAGIPLFMQGDAEYKRLGLNPDELSFIDTKRMVMEDMCVLTGVPAPILAAVTDVKYSNFEEAHISFLRDTIRPLLNSLTQVLNWDTITPDNQDLDFVDPTPENLENLVRKIEAGRQHYVLTTNELRELMGQEPVKGGDEILVPWNLSPLGSTQEPQKTADKTEKSVFKHPLQDEPTRRKYWLKKEATSVKLEDQTEKAMQKLFNDQKNRIIEYIGNIKQFKKKDLLGSMFDKPLEIRIAQTAILNFLRGAIETGASDSFQLVGYGRQFVFGSAIEGWMDARSDLFAKEITDTTFNKLTEQFSESLNAGENRQQLIARIQDTYEGYTEKRATTIARTEIHGAYQKGTYEGYVQAGVPIKIWVAVRDIKTRESHARLDGQKRATHQPFSNGLMFPGDSSGPASETVNCRCTA